MKIKDISRISHRKVVTVRPDAALSDAIKKLVDNHIGAVPVYDAREKLVGILSERDVLEWVSRGKADVGGNRVKDIMTQEVLICHPEDNVEDILKILTERGIRHLPVISGNNLVSMLSIRDIIEEMLLECNIRVQHLHDYIAGGST
jgi:CBS domain-containing protein